MNGMESGDKRNTIDNRIKQLETQISELKFEVEEKTELLKQEQEKGQFYQLVADFTFGWELWFEPTGKIKYCSPSCHDITGYTANQVVSAKSVSELLVFTADREKFDQFLSNALNQFVINPSHDFRIMTRTRQIRWCSVNVRGVYNRQGRYLGVRASIQDVTRLKKALGHINELSVGKSLENRSRQRLKSELDVKERELVAFLLELSRKNELIALIARHLRKMANNGSKDFSEQVGKVLHLIENAFVNTVDWELVEVQIEKLNPGFLERLSLKHPKLTQKDRKLCACIRLGLTSKEIAGLNNLAPQSVEIARVRLRKKLKLHHETRLTNYLFQL
jgi:PAS domain S-box-containing protein